MATIPSNDEVISEGPVQDAVTADSNTLSAEDPTSGNLPPSTKCISPPKPTTGMTDSSTPLGNINAARRPPLAPTISSRNNGLNVSQDILARIQAVHLGRQGAPPSTSNRPQIGTPSGLPQSPVGSSPRTSTPGSPLVSGPGGVPANFKLPAGMTGSSIQNFQLGRRGTPSLAEKRGQMLHGGLPGSAPAQPGAGRKKPGLKLSQMNGDTQNSSGSGDAKPKATESLLDKYAEYIDKETGTLKFKGKATINAQGVQFSSGTTFNISLDEVDTLDELGKGNYGTVYKVRHSRPKMRRPGLGLAGNKAQGPSASSGQTPHSPTSKVTDNNSEANSTTGVARSGTGVIMAMKELRLELDDAKFAAIIMELDVLHRCISPYIVDFYGAFFQEGAVYICLEFMDGGSIDKLYADGVPEPVLRKITLSTTMGLKFLKEKHNIIHRDVKPTNILINTRGQVKICDFGVSGNLVASIAKTNIGCQSYMAPERISSGGVAQAGANPGGGTYSVQSDIWSLGLTIIECAMGRYPYPPETYNNIFSQLSAIVDGATPDLPAEGYSEAARNFTSGCLNKIPNLRPTYAMLLQHAWLAPLLKPSPISEDVQLEPAEDSNQYPPDVIDKEVASWVMSAIERKRNGTLGKNNRAPKPALHAAPLDAVSSPSSEAVSIVPTSAV